LVSKRQCQWRFRIAAVEYRSSTLQRRGEIAKQVAVSALAGCFDEAQAGLA